jgi:8-oxo-dGTP pyrophosphatase MutT (NUDIX family)
VTSSQPQPWRIKSSEIIADCRIFKVRKDVVVSPRTGQPHDMFVLEQPNWVNVIPLTSDDQVVMVEQWRHGSRSVQLETPGGLMDKGETPEQCGGRELLEETGYSADSVIRLGTIHPNPAIQSNLQHYLFARNCRKVTNPKLDLAEDVAVKLVPLADIPEMIRACEITHGIVIGGFYWLNLYRQEHG